VLQFNVGRFKFLLPRASLPEFYVPGAHLAAPGKLPVLQIIIFNKHW
jgi:hypothetical protein